MFLSNVVFPDNVKILIFFNYKKNPQSISTMTYHNKIHSKMLMNWTSALCLDFQKNVYSKKKKPDVLDFPGWVIKSICCFGVTVSFTSTVV